MGLSLGELRPGLPAVRGSRTGGGENRIRFYSQVDTCRGVAVAEGRMSAPLAWVYHVNVFYFQKSTKLIT